MSVKHCTKSKNSTDRYGSVYLSVSVDSKPVATAELLG